MNDEPEFIKKVGETIIEHKMLEKSDAVLIGVSGGPDSVSLLHVFLWLAKIYALTLGVAHFNHRLRGEDADSDERFVSELAESNGVKCFTEKKDVYAFSKINRLSVEEAGRSLRYDFFYRVMQNYGYNRLALGHHKNDNAEQVLMNIIRGSGTKGLSGIPPVRDGRIIRPLFRVDKKEIIAFLKKNQYPYVLDATNENRGHLRNRIRQELVPLLKTCYNNNIVDALDRLSDITRSENDWMETEAGDIFLRIATVLNGNGRVDIPVDDLCRFHPALKKRLIRQAIGTVKGDLRRIGRLHIESILDILKSDSTSWLLDLPGSVTVEREKDTIRFYACGQYAKKNKGQNHLLFQYTVDRPGKFLIKETETVIDINILDDGEVSPVCFGEERVAYMDLDMVSFPLVIRNPLPGDRFTPLGMKGSQKLKKFFINRKIAREKRWKCPLLISDKEIIWIAGHQINERVKITPETRRVLKAEVLLA